MPIGHDLSKGYQKPRYEVADIINQYRGKLKEGTLSAQQKKVFTNLSQCRTDILGGHLDKCNNPDCVNEHISYNSCRDRHCPKCNGLKRKKWVRLREEELLPVKYFHVVFTVPDKLNSLFLANPAEMYKLLFRSAWETIQTFAADQKYLGGKTGMTAMLHSWGQNIYLHPHLHCIVIGGGLTKQNKWRNTRSEGKFLFPVKSLSKVFRGKFTDGLIKLDKKGEISLEQKFNPKKKYLHPFYKNKWVVYAKLPMHNAKQAIEYIGKYANRVAISNHRIKNMEDGKVEFSYFNYNTSKPGTIVLKGEDFLQRFALHVLPKRFMKVRYYGLLSANNKKAALAQVREVFGVQKPPSIKGMGWRELYELFYGHAPTICPKCKKGTMVTVKAWAPNVHIRGSPVTEHFEPNYQFDLQ